MNLIEFLQSYISTPEFVERHANLDHNELTINTDNIIIGPQHLLEILPQLKELDEYKDSTVEILTDSTGINTFFGTHNLINKNFLGNIIQLHKIQLLNLNKGKIAIDLYDNIEVSKNIYTENSIDIKFTLQKNNSEEWSYLEKQNLMNDYSHKMSNIISYLMSEELPVFKEYHLVMMANFPTMNGTELDNREIVVKILDKM